MILQLNVYDITTKWLSMSITKTIANTPAAPSNEIAKQCEYLTRSE